MTLSEFVPITVMAILLGYRIRAGQWPTAAFDAVILFALYILFRSARRPKGPRMALLSKNDIFGADDRKYEDVEVPEWTNGSGDCTVRLRSLTGTERDAYEASIQKQIGGKPVRDMRNFRARLIALSAVDESGQPLFSQNDVVALASRSSAALNRLYDVCCELSGFSDEDVEALEGNSEPAQSGPSTSVSQPISAPALSPNSWQPSAPVS